MIQDCNFGVLSLEINFKHKINTLNKMVTSSQRRWDIHFLLKYLNGH